jgi:murein DD-endopeptidase MepM/ murein hydrolase activator NlpD
MYSQKRNDFKDLLKYLLIYQSKKTKYLGQVLENIKNQTVGLFMHKRGRLQKHVWHTSVITLASIGFLSSGILNGDSIIATSFPGMGAEDPRLVETYDPTKDNQILGGLIDFKTSVSEKPRSEIIEYEVKSGETISQISQKFNISQDTIKWANGLDTLNSIKPGQKLKILPVSGVAHTVKAGDTLESVAKKYSTESQGILDFPFNDVPDDFKLKVGQLVIVPDGEMPEENKPASTPKSKGPLYIADGAKPSTNSFTAPGGGNFMWPTVYQMISTYFAWWHPGVDMSNRSGPPVVAADGGTVTVAGWPDNYGYGNRVIVDHGNGYQTLYAHLANIYVSSGQKVSKGQSVGQMGSTGRSTGTHLHFEMRYKGVAVNPLAILK